MRDRCPRERTSVHADSLRAMPCRRPARSGVVFNAILELCVFIRDSRYKVDQIPDPGLRRRNYSGAGTTRAQELLVRRNERGLRVAVLAPHPLPRKRKLENPPVQAG